jgi:hypothetical protein
VTTTGPSAVSGQQNSIFRAYAGEWTITTHLGELLLEAEESYGGRVQDWTPIGVELRDGSRSALMPLGDTEKRFIVLNSCLEYDMGEAVFHVSHEVIHLLGPVKRANCLEEGLATFFSLNNSRTISRRDSLRSRLETTDPLYIKALEMYELFVSNGGDIKALRRKQPYISKATPKLIKECSPRCSQTDIEKLLGWIDDL